MEEKAAITVRPQTAGGFVRSVSGLLITKENPLGLTPKECTVLAVVLSVVGGELITREHKVDISNELNQSLQVTTNYLSKFKKKGVIVANRLHPLFWAGKITILWNGSSATTT